jgi:hypothetical protein
MDCLHQLARRECRIFRGIAGGNLSTSNSRTRNVITASIVLLIEGLICIQRESRMEDCLEDVGIVIQYVGTNGANQSDMKYVNEQS